MKDMECFLQYKKKKKNKKNKNKAKKTVWVLYQVPNSEKQVVLMGLDQRYGVEFIHLKTKSQDETPTKGNSNAEF
jgi:hypothetical protein